MTTLSDKIEESNIPSNGFIFSGDVKQSIKEFIEELKKDVEWDMISNGGYKYKEIIDTLAKSKFGDEILR